MNILTIDIKTRSCDSIKNNGVFAYAQNKSTQIICVTVKKNQANPMVWLPPELRRREIISISDNRLRQTLEEADLIQAFDITTEFALWKYTLCRLYPWFPEIPVRKLSCISARAAYFGMNFPIRALMEEIGISADEQLLSPPDPVIFFHPGKKIPLEILTSLLRFCMASVDIEAKIAQKFIELPPGERHNWLTCLAMNDNGIFIRKEAIEKQQEQVEGMNKELQEEFHAITGIGNAMNGDALLAYINKNGISLKNLDQENVEQVLRSMPVCRIRRALEIRKDIVKNNPLRFSRLLSLLGNDSRIRGLWEYHGDVSGSCRIKYLSDIADLNGLMEPGRDHVFRICRFPDLKHGIFSNVMDCPIQNQLMVGRNLKEYCKKAILKPGVTSYCGNLKISYFGDFLKFVLPSGRDLYLYKPEQDNSGQLSCKFKYNRVIQRKDVSGSYILHLLEEAIVSDVVFDHLTLLRQNFFTPVLATSFDIVTEDPILNEGDEFFQDVISSVPAWLHGNSVSPVMCLCSTWNSES